MRMEKNTIHQWVISTVIFFQRLYNANTQALLNITDIYNLKQVSKQNVIQPPLFWFSKPALFATSGL